MTGPSILGTKHARPLEREFEAWIVREIEDYFQEVGLSVLVWAVSPTFEKTWPADEVIGVTGKLIGLQFKQAQLTTGTLNFDRLKWSLREPKGQYELVQQRSEIFYALPTFINRTWARGSLNHCLFWRPPTGVVDYNAWYANPGATTPHRELVRSDGSMRWGELVESVARCHIGLRFDERFKPRDYVAELAAIAARAAATDIVRGDNDVTPSSLLFLLYVPLA